MAEASDERKTSKFIDSSVLEWRLRRVEFVQRDFKQKLCYDKHRLVCLSEREHD